MGLFSSIGNLFSSGLKAAGGVSGILGSPVLGAALGGLGTMFSAKAQNRANMAIAGRQMDFQERMSGTSYQRAVEDMKAAGLNPGLMYGSGAGASTPAGASIPAVNPAYGESVNAALAAMRTKAEIANIKAQTNLTLNTARSAAVNAAIDETIGSGVGSAMKVGGSVVNAAKGAASLWKTFKAPTPISRYQTFYNYGSPK